MTERSKRLGSRYVAAAVLLGLAVVGCVAFVQRDQWLVHYHVDRYVSRAEPASRSWLAERIPLALPALLSHLTTSEPGACGRVGDLLRQVIAERGDPTEPEHAHTLLSIAARIHEHFSEYSPTGRMIGLSIAGDILETNLGRWSPNVPTALETAGGVVWQGIADPERAVRIHTLDEMTGIWHWDGSDDVARSLVEQWKRDCYNRAVRRLDGAAEAERIHVARAIAGCPYHEGDSELFALLEDESPTVRKSVLIALDRAGRADLTSEQKAGLNESLTDPDPEVRSAARGLLEKSGVRAEVLELIARMKDPEPARRLEALALALDVLELEPYRLVLGEFARDPSPRVRAAVDDACMSLLLDESAAYRELAIATLAASGAHSLDAEQKRRVIGHLHSADPRVHAASRTLLLGSGTSESVLRLAELLTHPSPAERAKAVRLAVSIPQFDPLPWIEALADDPAPAVRAAVARAASETKSPPLLARLRRMAESDPDPAVRELSRQFLARQDAAVRRLR